MKVIYANSVSQALALALLHIKNEGIREDSRNGPVLVCPDPVVTVYNEPCKRVLWSGVRDANPFFHLMESMWMLAGLNDLWFPLQYNRRFSEYSDDDDTIWGAYGWRWRRFFGYDQLNVIVEELQKNPASRRCVLSMWNAAPDLCGVPFVAGDSHSDLLIAMQGGKDVPCNTHAYFDCRGGVLNMTVCNRSNDALWGAYGANAVHFSILQEYVAARIGVPVGVYRQMSNNLHLYADVLPLEKLDRMVDDVDRTDRYATTHGHVAPTPVVDCRIVDWHDDLQKFFTHGGLWNEHIRWKSRFIGETVAPMYRAHYHWRNKEYDEAMAEACKIVAWEWRTACIEWLERRAAKRKENGNG